MIARLEGEIAEKHASSVVIMADGVGYEVHIPVSTYYEIPDEGGRVSLRIKTVVRDDAIELFGFLTQAEKDAFLLLNSVSKIGPRLALNILSGIGPNELASAVGQKNIARLNGIPGVGKKTAERLVVELKDKVALLAGSGGIPPTLTDRTEDDLDQIGQDVLSALLNLGYSRPEAEKAVGSALKENGSDEGDISSLLKLSLKVLQKT